MIRCMRLELQNNYLPLSGTNYDTKFLCRHSNQVLIQETATGRYLRQDGFWTANREFASGFCSSATAIEQVQRLNLGSVQLVLARNIEICEVIPMIAGDSVQPLT